MFTTSLVTAAVAALVAPGASVGDPTWQPNYRTALVRSAEQHRPVAVFIANGTDGYSKLVTDGGFDAETTKLLGQGYVCLYVDTTTASGTELSKAFGMTEGLVISDKDGKVQTLRHQGAFSRTALKGYLEQCNTVTTVAATQAHSVTAPVAAPVTYAPQFQAQPVLYPGYGVGGCPGGNCYRAPVVTGGCPGGNCYR